MCLAIWFLLTHMFSYVCNDYCMLSIWDCLSILKFRKRIKERTIQTLVFVTWLSSDTSVHMPVFFASEMFSCSDLKKKSKLLFLLWGNKEIVSILVFSIFNISSVFITEHEWQLFMKCYVLGILENMQCAPSRPEHVTVLSHNWEKMQLKGWSLTYTLRKCVLSLHRRLW